MAQATHIHRPVEPRAVRATAGRAWLGGAVALLASCNEPNPHFDADAKATALADVSSAPSAPAADSADDPRSPSSEARSTDGPPVIARDDASDGGGAVQGNADAGPGCSTLVAYADLDGDGYGDDGKAIDACATPDKYVLESGDCDDQNNAVSPGQTELFDQAASAAVGFDYDCDGAWQRMWPSLVSCRRNDGECVGVGWLDAVPSCGVEARFAECGCEHGDCVVKLDRRKQRCR